MYSNILIAIDPTKIKSSQEAVATVKQLSKEGGKITILSVIEDPPEYFADQISGEVEHGIRGRIYSDLQRFIGKYNVEAKIVIVKGHACGSIINHQMHHANDLIIITSHKPNEKDHLMGATALNVVRSAECPVFIIR